MILSWYKKNLLTKRIVVFIWLKMNWTQKLKTRRFKGVLRKYLMFGKTISFLSPLSKLLMLWGEWHELYRWIEVKEGKHLLVHLDMNLGLEKIQDFKIEECKVLSLIFLTICTVRLLKKAHTYLYIRKNKIVIRINCVLHTLLNNWLCFPIKYSKCTF